MPTIITASELRSVLGVSSSLYNDAYLNQIIDLTKLEEFDDRGSSTQTY